MAEKLVVITDQVAYHIDPEGVSGKTYVVYLDETITAQAIAYFRDQNIPVYDCRDESSILAEVLRRVSDAEFLRFKEEETHWQSCPQMRAH